ncbi:MAG TPA: inositol monophosphatase family protein [Ilumatobacteraceae bacterium]|nr:inositol monophosphatase family protein [Ilumatobacteraceae bacterium]
MPPADGSQPDEPIALRELAGSLARDAGQVAHAGRRAATTDGSLGATTKSTGTDIVTQFDRAAEAEIVSRLRSTRPDDAIVGEEGTADAGTSGFAWLIDPIDGTTSFVYDLPTWCCSVAVARDGMMLAGAVYVPALDELFDAALGDGARLNGRPIAPSGETELGRALVGTGFSYFPDRRQAQGERLARIIGSVRDIRRMGSAAIDLCFVAAGRLDVYFEEYLNSWDSAAGELIAREAGAITSDFSGRRHEDGEILVATPALHAPFVDLLAAAMRDDHAM